MEWLETMRDLGHRTGHFEAIAGRALELLESGEWQETYREARLEGAWNEAADMLFPGRDEFKVEGERRNG